MATKLEVTYNHLGQGPRVTAWGDKPLLVYWSNVVKDKKLMSYAVDLQGGYWYQQGRQWFCNWVVEVFEWNKGNLNKIHTDYFNPYNKRAHFHLDDTASYQEHVEYTKACLEFIDYWNLESYSIETPYAHELHKEFPGIFFAHKILDEVCYVNYVIKKSPSSNFSWENYKMWTMNDEYVFFNHIHPCNFEDQTPYEFAKSVLFGPDYDKLDEYIPYAWTLNERVVS